jgi:drug/metabolite transporter (DMT)-like permease
LEGGEHGLTLGTLATGLLSGFGYALYSIFGRYALDRGYHSFTSTAWTFLIAAVCLAPFVDYGSIGAALSSDAGTVILFALGVAVIVTVIPYLLYTAGLETILSSRASIMASVEPVVASIISVTVFGERMSLLGALGVLLVLGAVVLLNLPQKIHKS